MLHALVGPLVGLVGKFIDQVVEDPNERNRLKAEAANRVQSLVESELKGAVSIIITEAQGRGLKANWRPLTMLVFVGLVVAKWLGFTAPGVTEAVELELLAIIKVGLGGYVLGRSGEKIIGLWKRGE